MIFRLTNKSHNFDNMERFFTIIQVSQFSTNLCGNRCIKLESLQDLQELAKLLNFQLVAHIGENGVCLLEIADDLPEDELKKRIKI